MSGREVELDITALAAGGDGLGRDANGRVTFVPRAAPGDRVRVRVVRESASFARGELLAVIAPSPVRVDPPCEYFRGGCGGCQWQHVARSAQLAAKQAIVAGALRGLPGLTVDPIADPCPPLGWRRRARFHVVDGRVGLFRAGSHDLVPLTHCPQLEPPLDTVLAKVIAAAPPEGELVLLIGHTGEIAVATARPWPAAARLIRDGIASVSAGRVQLGASTIAVEPDLRGSPWEFAQASARGNEALVAIARSALGPGPGRLLELHAGAGNFTRAYVAAGWHVVPSDAVRPASPPPDFELGRADEVLTRLGGPFDAIALDPPRTGAKEAIAGIARHAPSTVVYVSCDPATLARDAARFTDAGYRAERAWPVDLMPQTAHVEVVMRLVRSRDGVGGR
jgi:23S rRNA (uracil1939-C5)-methyltransferase